VGTGFPKRSTVKQRVGSDFASIKIEKTLELKFFQLLIERGADFTNVDHNGLTAIDVAKSRGHDEIARLLHQWDDAS